MEEHEESGNGRYESMFEPDKQSCLRSSCNLHSTPSIQFRQTTSRFSIMPKQQEKKVIVKSTKLTQGEKNKIKQANKAKANPGKADAKKAKNDAKRAGRAASGSQKKLG